MGTAFERDQTSVPHGTHIFFLQNSNSTKKMQHNAHECPHCTQPYISGQSEAVMCTCGYTLCNPCARDASRKAAECPKCHTKDQLEGKVWGTNLSWNSELMDEIKKTQETKNYDFFLGHTKRSKTAGTEDFVCLLHDELTKHGFKVFYDRIDLSATEIEQCVRSAKESYVHVIVLDEMTPHAEWVLMEIEQSMAVGNPCIAIHRKDKFSWEEVGKSLWKNILSANRQGVQEYLFARGALQFDGAPQVRKVWMEETIKGLTKALEERKPLLAL
eukprot:GDKI01021563.1.p1 GENE.GDKI01021563.1~~GDKI01021563.1.p1  ORF type:complete len:272 (-),score=62.72 GDKI01021563.1:1699-2514(-)